MKRQRLVAIICVILCIALLPSCKLRRKQKATESEEEESLEDDETEDTSEDTSSEPEQTSFAYFMNVASLDQFISDGYIFAENVPVPTPTPIPVNQTSLGLTNDDDGYFSGPLENATVVDNEYFRFTIISAEATPDGYIVKSEFENKSDVAYTLYLRNPIFNNECNDRVYYTDVINAHSVLEDETNFIQCFENYDGSVPTRISFLILAIPASDNQIAVLADPVNQLNYIPVNIFPQGEDAYHYEEQELPPESSIMYDTEGAQFIIDSFEVSDTRFSVYYTFINKTTDYLQFLLNDGEIMLDKMMFKAGNQAIYVPPYGRQTGVFSVLADDIKAAGMDINQIKLVSLSLKANSLNDVEHGIKVLWETIVKKEVELG